VVSGTSADEKYTSEYQNCFARSGTTVNLRNNCRPTWGAANTGCTSPTTIVSGDAAYYYVYDEDHWVPQARPSGCPATNGREDDDCYITVVVGSTSGPGATDEPTNCATR